MKSRSAFLFLVLVGSSSALAADAWSGLYKVTRHSKYVKPCGSGGDNDTSYAFFRVSTSGDKLEVFECTTDKDCAEFSWPTREFTDHTKDGWKTLGATAISPGKTPATCNHSGQVITIRKSGDTITLNDQVRVGDFPLKGGCKDRPDVEADVKPRLAELKCSSEEIVIGKKVPEPTAAKKP